MAYIYGLRAKDTTLYFYVGSTKHDLAYRFKQHQDYMRLGYNKNRHFVNKARKIGWDNIHIDMLAECGDKSRWQLEDEWIKRLKKNGHPLTNLVYNNDIKHQEQAIDDAVTLDTFQSVVEILEGKFPKNGNALHDAGLDVALKLANHLIVNHLDYTFETIEDLTNEETNRQANSIRERILKMLERD